LDRIEILSAHLANPILAGTISPTTDYVERLAAAQLRKWPTIFGARASAAEVRNLLSSTLTDTFGAFSSGDLDLVCFGSLARQEWTSGSDVDWTLLIDGQATPDHGKLAREISSAISAIEFRGNSLKPPGPEGIFGNMAFSHDIIHLIGGQADTNKNTTQRVLLLLEATTIRHMGYSTSVGPFERVAKGVLYRYLHGDTNFASVGDSGSRIPRFLLNDIVRYWRTMCVDFAYKEWQQGGEKWALRNIKLRLSRKLLFVAGLLTVFSCFKNPALAIGDGDVWQQMSLLQGHLMSFVHSTPANILAFTLHELALDEGAAQILDPYESFLAKLDDQDLRKYLALLPAQTIYQDATFLEIRELSHKFQKAIDSVFFARDTELFEFTAKYGVF
jgi:hypothetical protein